MSIHLLVRQCKYSEVEQFLTANSSVINEHEPESPNNNYRRTPLQLAICANDVRMVALLAKFKPDTTLKDAANLTALDLAVAGNLSPESEKIIKILVLECGADLNQYQQDGSRTYLQNAVFSCLYDLARLLLSLGANCIAASKLHETPLDSIAYNNLEQKWWELLLDYGAFINLDVSKLNMVKRPIPKKNIKKKDDQNNAFKKVIEKTDIEKITLFEQVTKGRVVIGATWGEKKITRETPGFKEAITNFAEYRAAIPALRDNKQLMVINTILRYIVDYAKDGDLKNIAILANKNQFGQISLKALVSANISLFKSEGSLTETQVNNLDNLPSELKEYLTNINSLNIEQKK